MPEVGPYIARMLSWTDSEGRPHVDEQEFLLGRSEPVIVLGEPGMGKTELMKWLGSQPEYKYITANAFLRLTEFTSVSGGNRTLVIDALDEVAAAREGDPVQHILEQLGRAGAPPFILSCRSADWNGGPARQDIEEDYHAEPLQVTLEPFTREESQAFLAARLGEEPAAKVIAHYAERGLSPLFGNPQTLSLIASAANSNAPLAETRAGLLANACAQMVLEHNDRHGQAAATEDLLDAAGAACAALLITAKEAISARSGANAGPDDLRLAEVSELPCAGLLGAVMGSRLFIAVPGDRRFACVHRTVAEFLAARWLARLVETAERKPLIIRRIMVMITLNGGVPASLRGLHAWLAHHSPAMAMQVIRTDAFGVLRYGDGDGLTVEQGRALLEALAALESDNPWFRHEDWSRQSARGLAQLELLRPIREMLTGSVCGFHLKTLLLEAIKGSLLASKLADDLSNILFSAHQTYRERRGAGDAMLGADSSVGLWRDRLSNLVAMGDANSRQLALDFLKRQAVADFSNAEMVDIILSGVGWKNPGSGYSSRGDLHSLMLVIPDGRIAGLLDTLTEEMGDGTSEYDTDCRWELIGFIRSLAFRQMKIGIGDPLRLWRWFRPISASGENWSQSDHAHLFAYFQANEEIRRAIQRHVLFEADFEETLWIRAWRLADISQRLRPSTEEVCLLLGEMAAWDSRVERNRDLWRDLLQLGRTGGVIPDEVINASKLFARDDAELLSFVQGFINPEPPTWQVEQETRRAARAMEKAEERAKREAHYLANKDGLEAGEHPYISTLARVYVGGYAGQDRELQPHDRVAHWVGVELAATACLGFEAALHREDMLTAEQISESYANSRHYHFAYVLIAGLAERVRLGRGVGDLSPEILLAGRCKVEAALLSDEKWDPLKSILDTALRGEPGLYETYLRTFIEPQLTAKSAHATGLYALMWSKEDKALASKLALDWLNKFPDLAFEAEREMLNHLLFAERFEDARMIAKARRSAGFRDKPHRMLWEAAEFLCNFESFGREAAVEPEFIWYLGHCLGLERWENARHHALSAAQLAWIVKSFRTLWPYTEAMGGEDEADRNPREASRFLSNLIDRFTSDSSDEACKLVAELSGAPEDGYSERLRFVAAQQRQSRIEAGFAPHSIETLSVALTDGPPQSTAEILAIVLDELDTLQTQLRGASTNPVDLFYESGKHKDENACRDVVLNLLVSRLPHGIVWSPEVAMPGQDRADCGFQCGTLRLPVEAKGQWHRDLWRAAQSQLLDRYARNWQAGGRGLYLVFWFGDAAKFQGPPKGVGSQAATPDELKRLLHDALPAQDRARIEVFVLDVSR